ncbi:hypothetical protein [Halomarina rubra]|uniref:Uncharacterized protein n=1 Tax=Halomarina rubra TaxID=2071873 RepID=A0ABD6ATY2_9EURY|nr:hypothetical protein [Halomarina rubra]
MKHQLRKQVSSRRRADTADESRFDELLERHGAGHDEAFVNVGLGDVKGAFGGNPYEFVVSKLDDAFDSTLAPGFTDYFKTSGVYHKEFSRPKHGSFVRQFLADADYRTDDAIKSFLVRGDYRFDDCVHDDSYHDDGCYAKLEAENTLAINVGTAWLVCPHVHYLEAQCDVDYVESRTFDGVMYRDRTNYERIEQTCDIARSKFYSWNRSKLEGLLEDEGVLHSYDLNGLSVQFLRLGDLTDALAPKLREDPYWLVTL